MAQCAEPAQHRRDQRARTSARSRSASAAKAGCALPSSCSSSGRRRRSTPRGCRPKFGGRLIRRVGGRCGLRRSHADPRPPLISASGGASNLYGTERRFGSSAQKTAVARGRARAGGSRGPPRRRRAARTTFRGAAEGNAGPRRARPDPVWRLGGQGRRLGFLTACVVLPADCRPARQIRFDPGPGRASLCRTNRLLRDRAPSSANSFPAIAERLPHCRQRGAGTGVGDGGRRPARPPAFRVRGSGERGPI